LRRRDLASRNVSRWKGCTAPPVRQAANSIEGSNTLHKTYAPIDIEAVPTPMLLN
jgi:hypothetical protein